MAEPMSKVITKDGPFRYYMGWDSHEIIAHEIAAFSCKARASVPVEIIPLQQHPLRARGIYKKELDPKQNTEFTYLRFLIPYLANYKGWALFTDDDFMWQVDIAELLDQADERYAVMCVQHELVPQCDIKLAGVPQEIYPRKNWSSVMLFNCAHPDCKKLTPDLVAKEGPKYLHRMEWTTDEAIGALSYEWNWLVDWYDLTKHKGAKVIHWTDGGPWYPDYRTRGVDYQKEWFEELARYEASLPAPRLLGPYERFSYLEPPSVPLQGYPNSDAGRWTWEQDPEWQEYVRTHILADAIAKAEAERKAEEAASA